MDERRRKYFEEHVDDWDKSFTAEDLEILSFLIDSFDVKQNQKVVDLGCGTGVLFDILRRKVAPGGMVVGVDSCPGMVKKARQNFPFENVYELDADVESLPLKEDIFDHAITFAAFAHFTYPGDVIKEVARVLKKSGHFFIIHLLGSEELQQHHSEIGGPVAGDHLPPDEELITLFEQAGFTDIKITDHPGLYLASAAKG